MKITIKAALLVLPLSMTANIYAAGFQINPTASGVARAMGGSGIIGEDLGDMFYNPASLNLLKQDRSIQLGSNLLKLENKFVNRGSVLTSGADNFPLTGSNSASDDLGMPIGMFYTQKAPWNDNIRLGASLTSPWGLSTTYDDDWLGRYHGISTELIVIDFNLNAAWKVSDSLMLGVGISSQSAEATIEQAAPDAAAGADLLVKIQADDRAFGFNLGLIYQATEELKLGVSYRSKVSYDLDGDSRVSLLGTRVVTQDVAAPLDIPESLHFSAHYQPIGKRWSIAGGVRRTRWSRFDELRIDFRDGSPSSVVPQNWVNGYTSAISVDYKLANSSKLIFSVGYDESPVSNPFDRSVQVPEADRRIVGFGYETANPFELCNNCTAYFGYQRTMVDDRDINNTAALSPTFSTTLTGHYESGAINVFSGHLVYSF